MLLPPPPSPLARFSRLRAVRLYVNREDAGPPEERNLPLLFGQCVGGMGAAVAAGVQELTLSLEDVPCSLATWASASLLVTSTLTHLRKLELHAANDMYWTSNEANFRAARTLELVTGTLGEEIDVGLALHFEASSRRLVKVAWRRSIDAQDLTFYAAVLLPVRGARVPAALGWAPPAGKWLYDAPGAPGSAAASPRRAVQGPVDDHDQRTCRASALRLAALVAGRAGSGLMRAPAVIDTHNRSDYGRVTWRDCAYEVLQELWDMGAARPPDGAGGGADPAAAPRVGELGQQQQLLPPEQDDTQELEGRLRRVMGLWLSLSDAVMEVQM
ncbi:hypothetical protein HYH02_000344 [Chlamydomonas schloesseri]|uniref:Uncharacterized protein n=1 Tax=Chlamydomonas schloesseri TaxID=2026947 RepID=A0A835WUY9_9CHLO|nr:hypothetical protein HYH02_000344 [Chlamydomonas schloesseri]|eukprot:KAG2454497.1 hypothetical protein HYH02_000344 [Chlamydomonas schloesseri]